MSLKRFGTIEGVFIPSLLSIFGVIMYLRLSWVVGEVGIIGALIIIALANVISLSTGLSVSSIVTNIRIGHGGAYSIIRKSLGVEAGGAIGIPLYLAQAISVAFYIVGFGECWVYVFPEHSFLVVCLTAWVSILIVSYCSARLAFRIQYGIFAAVVISLVSIFLGHSMSSSVPMINIPTFSGNFFRAFSVFFPAVTGFMAGLSMSGELSEPKKSIPRGTLSATAVSIVIYISLAIWFWKNISSQDLINNAAVVVDMGRWRLPILVGIMGATLSSALNMCVAAPRTLFALSNNTIIPFLKPFMTRNKKGEPTTAILLTSFIALITILAGTLDQVASLLTMFFLMTYGLINLSVFIEQFIGISSFRPSFRISKIISFFGTIGCLGVMFLIDARFSLIAMLVIGVIYFLLVRQETKKHSPDVRSGLLIFITEQLAKIVEKLPYYPKIWKPNLIIPAENINTFSSALSIIRSIVYPSGRLTVFHLTNKTVEKEQREEVIEILKPIKEDGILTTTISAQTSDYLSGCTTILQTMGATHFPPNTFFYILPGFSGNDEESYQIVKQACIEKLGLIILTQGQIEEKEDQKMINLWIRKGSPNIDLSILIALQLQKNWEGRIRLLQIADNRKEKDEGIAYLSRLAEIMRFPSEIDIEVLVGKFPEIFNKTPSADINIFGMPQDPNLNLVRNISNLIKTPALFLRDSPHESAIA